MLRSVSAKAATRVRVGTNVPVPAPTCAVDTNANRNVAVNVLSAYLSVWSWRIHAMNRGENSLVPNWTMRRMTDVTNPVNASIPLPNADSADVALPALIEWIRTI